MRDITNREYSGWLEEALQFIAEENPEKIAVVARCKDGSVCTKYFGCDTEDVAMFGHYISTDALMATVMANAGRVVRHAEEMEDEEE